MSGCTRIFLVSLVTLLVCSRLVHSRYLPTRSEGNNLDRLLQALAQKEDTGVEAAENMGLQDEGIQENKRFQYMYLCFDKNGKYHMCYKSYRRRK